MELTAENGFVVSISSGCKRKLGRGPELAIFDKTVSREQVLVELKGQSAKRSSTDHESSLYSLIIEVLGPNPVCIIHIGRSKRRKCDSQELVFLNRGEKDTLLPGDKISLSLISPQFFTAKGGDRKDHVDTPKSPAEDDLLRKWNDRKNMKLAGQCASHSGLFSPDAPKNISLKKKEEMATAEEKGIAQAVARRQKRALERQQQQEKKMQDKPINDVENIPALHHGARDLEERLKFEDIDPVDEFGFLVEGSEFDQYKKGRHSNTGRWIWPPLSTNTKDSSDEDETEDRQTRRSARKAGREEEDEEWRGEDQLEDETIARSRKGSLGGKMNLRSNVASTSKSRGGPKKPNKPGGRTNKNTREDQEEEDETDETLGGFIVDDEEEDVIDDDGDSEEELSDDDDEIEDEDEEDTDSQKSPTKNTKKPLCKYGKNCYRKNADHHSQFRHQ